MKNLKYDLITNDHCLLDTLRRESFEEIKITAIKSHFKYDIDPPEVNEDMRALILFFHDLGFNNGLNAKAKLEE